MDADFLETDPYNYFEVDDICMSCGGLSRVTWNTSYGGWMADCECGAQWRLS